MDSLTSFTSSLSTKFSLRKKKKERRPHNLTKDGIMGEISSCGLPILLRYEKFRITFPFSIQMQIISNMKTFQMEGKSLEECLETTSALFHPLPGNLPDLQVYRQKF